VCCSVLQCVAVCCGALQCIVVCCSGLWQFVECGKSQGALCASMCRICQVDVQTCVSMLVSTRYNEYMSICQCQIHMHLSMTSLCIVFVHDVYQNVSIIHVLPLSTRHTNIFIYRHSMYCICQLHIQTCVNDPCVAFVNQIYNHTRICQRSKYSICQLHQKVWIHKIVAASVNCPCVRSVNYDEDCCLTKCLEIFESSARRPYGHLEFQENVTILSEDSEMIWDGCD